MKMLFKAGPVVGLLTCVIGLTAGFIPTSMRRFAADAVFFQFRSLISVLPGPFNDDSNTITHSDMTRQAILRTIADVFISNPNPKYLRCLQNVQKLVNSNKKLDVSELIDAYYGNENKQSRKLRKEKLTNSIDDVGMYNGNVDIDELRMTAAHFDSEQFEAAQKRLVDFRGMASMLIKKNDLKSYDNARKFTGRLLHTLQDFYSHTNWIENWIGEVDTINPYRVLGERNKMIENVAQLTNPCTDCRLKVEIIDLSLDWLTFDFSLKSLYLKLLSVLSDHVESTSQYECEDNLDSSLKSQKLLTSGYSQGGKDTDDNVIVKPAGKCSHGGILDGSQDQPAKGGINKDSIHPELASHYRYHQEAADIAEQHSYEFLLSIRNDVNDDEFFGKFLGIEVGPIVVSFAAVIDTTMKTTRDLTGIQEMIMSFQASGNIQQSMLDMAVKYILVPLTNTGKHTLLEYVV